MKCKVCDREVEEGIIANVKDENGEKKIFAICVNCGEEISSIAQYALS